MLRDKLISNLCACSELEKYIVKYVTKNDINWFCDKHNSDKIVRECLYDGFVNYFGYAPKDGVHPFNMVWQKITKGVNIDPLFSQTDLYGVTYKKLTERINELYMGAYRNTINIILKAFAERDFDELDDKHCFESSEIYCDDLQNNIDQFADVVANNLDEDDLRTILSFCGKSIEE